ncbi:elongator complex protein 6-like [Tubulanus polymorphus]|uniref:elongator complex protein 6-like n=1 Tax=Tubulanus polymorphus TaxID=672921 RepID=UPI003DA356CE
MFADLNNILKWQPQNGDGFGEEILVKDADSCCLVAHFLAYFLRGSTPECDVCLVSTVQSFAHYNNVVAKLGLNLKQSHDDGKFIFINGLREISDLIIKKSCIANIKDFYFFVKSSVANAFKDGRRTVLIFDDLTSLISIGYSDIDVINLTSYVRSLVTMDDRWNSIIWMTQSTSDSERNLDSDWDRLQTSLSYRANTILDVEKLKSGRCKEVHGLIMIKTGLCSTTGIKSSSEKFHFRIQDKTVNFFPVGTSSAVL